MKKKIIPILLIAIVAGVVIWKFTHYSDFLYAGTLEATHVDISPQVTGIISSLAAKEGESVAKDQILIELACEDVKLAADIAERDFKRAKTLKSSGSMPEETYDKLAYKKNEAALRASWCSLRSPLNGTVLDRYHEPGELVTPNMKILTLADLSEVWAMIYVPETLLAHLTLGSTVQGLIPELKKEFPGNIVQIRDEAEFTPKNVQTREERTRLVYGVKISFPNPDRILKSGMTIEVKLPE